MLDTQRSLSGQLPQLCHTRQTQVTVRATSSVMSHFTHMLVAFRENSVKSHFTNKSLTGQLLQLSHTSHRHIIRHHKIESIFIGSVFNLPSLFSCLPWLTEVLLQVMMFGELLELIWSVSAKLQQALWHLWDQRGRGQNLHHCLHLHPCPLCKTAHQVQWHLSLN